MQDLWEKVKTWFAIPAKTTPQPKATNIKPTEPSDAQIESLKQQLAAATASIVDAYNHHATVHAAHYKGENFLLTNAHVTNNLTLASTAFHHKGKKYFPIFKGNQFAFAEHIALNPRGLVCNPNDTLSRNAEQSDIAILRLVPPEQSRYILYELSLGDDSRRRLNSAFNSVRGFENPLSNGKLSIHQLQALTERFHLAPIPVPTNTILARTPTAYSMAYLGNKPSFVQSSATENPNNQSTYDITFNCDNRIIPGHSGSPLADIAANGDFMLLGMVTGSDHDRGKLLANAVKVSQITAGLEAVIAAKTIRMTSLTQACETSAEQPIWLSAQAIRSITPPLEKAELQDVKTSNHPKTKPACPAR